MSIQTLLDEWAAIGPANWAEDRHGWLLDNGQPIALAAWQRAILGAYEAHRGDVSTILVSTVKKSGKTTFNSLLTCYRWLTRPGVHFVVGNDQDQSSELQINIIAAMVKRHPVLRRYTKVNRSELIFTPTGSRIVSLPMDYAGAAGANHLTVSFTELWAFTWESHVRMYEELTLPPLVGALRIVDSYAGFEGESDLFQRLWDRGLTGELVSDDWPIRKAGGMLAYIYQGEEAQQRCWRGTEAERVRYYREQQTDLREATYRRLHLNEWGSSEDSFITPEVWDRCILPGYACPGPSRSVRLSVAVDLAYRHDTAAVVSVWEDKGTVMLGPYRLFKPPVILGAVEDYLVELRQGYGLSVVAFDPYQAIQMTQNLRSKGLPVVEYPQSVPNLTRAGNALFDALKQGRLAAYAGATDLRTHVLNARGKEGPRGVRLVKEKQSKKIDGGVALAMAIAEHHTRPHGWAQGMLE